MLFEGIVPALLTPFDESGRVDTDALAGTADLLIEDGAGVWWEPAPWARPRASARRSAGW